MTSPSISRRRLLAVSALATAAAASPWSLPHAWAGLPEEDGSELWLRYRPTADPERRRQYRDAMSRVLRQGEDGPVVANAEAELRRALLGLTGVAPGAGGPAQGPGVVVIGTTSSPVVRSALGSARLARVGEHGFAVVVEGSGADVRRVVVGARSPVGLLHGVFHLVRGLQRGTELSRLSTTQAPRTPLRMLNHWDNLDGSVERGYAGRSVFDWQTLPEVTERMVDYARATASTGINASVLNNVNADADFITAPVLARLAPLGKMLAGWGISPWLSLNYASPMTLTAGTDDPITTADPHDPRVQQWWRDKITEITTALPDLGGFLVKANSEGQPGPLDYGRTHADGANMLARAVAPHDGLIVWRSFVHEDFGDWAEYQHRVFAPLDGQFDDNVIVQTKQGPIDFQVREPVHPLFGELRRTHQMLELQLTQEYTGHAVHTVYLAPMWRQVLDFTTQGPEQGPTVAEVVAPGGTRRPRSGIAGVSNFGDDADWTGYQLGAANSYAFGRLCWDPSLDPRELAAEWVSMTFGVDESVVATVVDLLMRSWPAYEDYTAPLGMGYLTNPGGNHFGPDLLGTLTQSHHSNAEGTGFDRTVATGSGFTGLYPDAWTEVYEDLTTVPDELLLFMHWVPYTHRLRSGDTVIQHIYDTHFAGVEEVRDFVRAWGQLDQRVDAARHGDVAASLRAQLAHATVWRDAVVTFFFDRSRVLDDHRGWVQLGLPGSRMLIGGQRNRVPVALTNATARPLSLDVSLAPSEQDWRSGTATVEVGSRGSETVEVDLVPPLVGGDGTLTVALDPAVDTLSNTPVTMMVAPSGQRCHLALDAGPADSAVLPGYQRLAPESTWSAGSRYGWVGGPRPNGRDRRHGEPLTTDLVGHPDPCTLRIAVPAGRHRAQLLVGDRRDRCRPSTVSVDGQQVLRTPDLAGGSFAWVDLELDGGPAGREVDLRLAGTTDWWKLAALVVPDPSAPPPPVVVAGATTEPVWWTGRRHDVVLTVDNTSDRPQAVTVEVVLPDGWSSSPVTVTLAPRSESGIAVPVTAGPTPTIERLSVTVSGEAGEIESGRLLEVVTTPHPDEAVLTLDAGPDGAPVLAGYQALTPADTWSGEGHGWVDRRPDSRDRGNTDDLRRDLVMHKERTELVLPVPPGRHEVWVLTGDAATDSAITVVSEGGTELARSGGATLPARAMVWFSFPLDGGTSGRSAVLELSGSGLNGLWRIAALALVAADRPSR